MKPTTTTLLLALTLTASALTVTAQDADQAGEPREPRPPRLQHRERDDQDGPRDEAPRAAGERLRHVRPDGERQRGPGPEERPRLDRLHNHLPPLVTVLDANHDGVIDQTEISQASAALKQLDKNGDGQLSREELQPMPGRLALRRDFEGRPGAGRPEGRPGEGRAPREPRFRAENDRPERVGRGRVMADEAPEAPEAPRLDRPSPDAQ